MKAITFNSPRLGLAPNMYKTLALSFVVMEDRNHSPEFMQNANLSLKRPTRNWIRARLF